MNGPESFPSDGGGMEEQKLTPVQAALKRLEENRKRKALEDSNRQPPPQPHQEQQGSPAEDSHQGVISAPSQNELSVQKKREKFFGVPVPSTPPVRPPTEVDSRELVLGPDGKWHYKE